MSVALTTIVTVSLIGLIGGVAYFELRRWQARGFLASVVLVAAAIAVFRFAMPDSLETKGAADETIAVVFCYFAMLLGMVAEYFYAQGEHKRRRFRFEPITFLMPVFASPIVFIPLLTITNEMSIGGAFTKAKLMVYLVAFQNGFFWKSFFEQSRQKTLESVPEMLKDILKKAGTPGPSAAATK
ncbi:MAG TPA: hypothetical protein VMB70_04930 [Terriglobia bacterium]|nr:hypothetical protein [Terriglobia bacterium]